MALVIALPPFPLPSNSTEKPRRMTSVVVVMRNPLQLAVVTFCPPLFHEATGNLFQAVRLHCHSCQADMCGSSLLHGLQSLQTFVLNC